MTEQPQHPTVFDSGTQHLGGVYAKALLGVTEKQGISDEVLEQFGSFLFDVMDKLPTLTSLLTSPRVSHEEKVEVMDKAFGGRMHPVLLNFLKVVSRHGRVDCLRAIHAELLKQFNSARGRVEVQVDVAAPMSDEMVAEIKERLQAALQAEVALKTRVNPDVLGGHEDFHEIRTKLLRSFSKRLSSTRARSMSAKSAPSWKSVTVLLECTASPASWRGRWSSFPEESRGWLSIWKRTASA
jgi:F-type H+-transporting ATPase subunit delta